MFKIFRLILLLSPFLYKLYHRNSDPDDPDDDDDESDPSLKERLKELAQIYVITKIGDSLASLAWSFLKKRIIRLGQDIRIDNLDLESIASKLKADFVDEDFQSKAVARTIKCPASGDYILVHCRNSVSIIEIWLISFLMRWKRTTPQEALAVYKTKPDVSSFYSSKVVCFGTILRRPSAGFFLFSFAVPAFSFSKKEDDPDDKNGIALLDIDESFDEGCSFLFRVK